MNLSTTRARMLTVAGIGVAAVVVIGGTATAASQITAHQLATGAVNSRVIKDGSVHQHDLTPASVKLLHQADGLQGQIDQLGQQGTAAITQLQQAITQLQGEVNALQPTNTGWVVDNDEGVINTAHEADLTLTNQSVTGSSLSNPNVNLAYTAGDPISFKYSYSGGAADGWGAPRVVAEIDGKWYSTMNDVTPVYNTGTQDGDLWTQSNSLMDANGNDQQPAPSGTITSIAVVYDNLPDPGTVHVHDLTVGGNVLSFK
jgi:TolA-binding protein